MRYANNLVALAFIILIILSAKNTYDRISTQIPITGAIDFDTATVTLFVISNETITITVPTIPSGTGGGGQVGPPRRPVNISKKIILELDAPPSQTMYAGDEMNIFITLKNKGDFILEDIALSSITNAPDLSLVLSKRLIDSLSINGEDAIILNIKSLVKPNAHIGVNNYFITVYAEVGNVDYSRALKFFLTLKERDYEKRLETEKELSFAEGFFNQTPECSDIAKQMKKAWTQYDESNYEKAMSAMQAALDDCRDRISPPEEGELLIPKTGMAAIFGTLGITSRLFFLIIIILLVLLAGLYYYLKRKSQPKPTEEKLRTKLEITFDDLINQTNQHIRHKDIAAAKNAYLQLNNLYEIMIASALPVSKKSTYYVKLINVRTELMRIMKK